MASLRQYWKSSLLFRRIAAVSVFAVLAVLVSLGSHIPRSISLPADAVGSRSTARIGEEQFVLTAPVVAEGGLVLSYVGSKNEVADLWLTNATLEGHSQQLFGGEAPAQPSAISYTTGDNPQTFRSKDTCHTVIEIRLAKGSAPLDQVKLYQTDQTAGAQRFRQVVLDAGRSTLELVVHTDPPPDSPTDAAGGPSHNPALAMLAPRCNKVLTVGGQNPIALPDLPVSMLVKGGTVDLRFNPADPRLPIWTGPGDTFEAASLGENALRARGFSVVAIDPDGPRQGPARLDVRGAKGTANLTLGRLKLGSEALKLDVGRDDERAVAYADGKPVVTYDLIAAVQGNLILSSVLAAVVLPGLIAWTKKNCFPAAPGETQTPAE